MHTSRIRRFLEKAERAAGVDVREVPFIVDGEQRGTYKTLDKNIEKMEIVFIDPEENEQGIPQT